MKSRRASLSVFLVHIGWVFVVSRAINLFTGICNDKKGSDELQDYCKLPRKRKTKQIEGDYSNEMGMNQLSNGRQCSLFIVIHFLLLEQFPYESHLLGVLGKYQ